MSRRRTPEGGPLDLRMVIVDRLMRARPWESAHLIAADLRAEHGAPLEDVIAAAAALGASEDAFGEQGRGGNRLAGAWLCLPDEDAFAARSLPFAGETKASGRQRPDEFDDVVGGAP